MRLTPNLNGASREALVEQRRAIYDRIGELLKAVRDGMPHGRDYQLAKDPANALAKDREEWIDFIEVLNAFQGRVSDEAAAIQNGRA